MTVCVEQRKRTLRMCLVLFKLSRVTLGGDAVSSQAPWRVRTRRASPARGGTPRPQPRGSARPPPFLIGSRALRVTPATLALPYRRGAGLGTRLGGKCAGAGERVWGRTGGGRGWCSRFPGLPEGAGVGSSRRWWRQRQLRRLGIFPVRRSARRRRRPESR